MRFVCDYNFTVRSRDGSCTTGPLHLEEIDTRLEGHHAIPRRSTRVIDCSQSLDRALLQHYIFSDRLPPRLSFRSMDLIVSNKDYQSMSGMKANARLSSDDPSADSSGAVGNTENCTMTEESLNSFSAYCQRIHGWSREEFDRVYRGYVQFMTL